MYTKDDAETWLDYTSKHKPPAKVAPPYANEDERTTALQYMAGYYNAILESGGTVANEATAHNPYVKTFVGSVGDGDRRLVSKDEAANLPISGKIVPGPYKAPPTPHYANPEAAPSLSWWQRFLAWLKRIFG